MLKFTDPQSIESPALSGKRLKQSLTVAAAIGVASVLLGLVVLGAWVFDVDAITSIKPDWATMKPNTALGFVFAGAALCLMQLRTRSAWAIPAAAACALATAAIGSLALVQYFLQVDFGINHAMFPAAEADFSAGQPAPITAFNYTMLGAALLLLCTRTSALRVAAQMLSVPALALSYLALLSYILSASSLSQVAGFSSVALHASVGQTLLGVAVMASSPETGITRMLLSRGEGGHLTRRLVLLCIVLFPLLGWLRVKAEAMGLITTEMGVAFLISVTLVIFLSFILLPVEALMRAEIEQERLGAAIVASKRAENTFRNVLNAAPDGMLVVDQSGKIVMTNAEAEKLFGYTKDEMIGQPLEFLVPMDSRGAHEKHRATFWRDPSKRPMSQGMKLAARRKDGCEIPVDIALNPLQTETGGQVVVSIRDISERMRFFEALSDKNVELERALKAKDHFLANMSHELRTPLTVILGFVKTLMMGAAGPLNHGQEKQASRIEANATHLLSLLNDLLDLAKVESGREEISLEPVDLRSVLEEVEASLRPLAERKGLALEVNCPPKHDLGRSSRRTLIQILLNLANNSIKFTDSGSVRIVVERAPGNNQAVTRIHVIDTGIGIRPEDQDKLFRPFLQLNPDANRGGTGLGLHLSRSLARSLGGDVTFRSHYGQGSTFMLILREASKAPAETRLAS